MQSSSRIDELLKMQKDLKNAITYKEEVKKFKLLTDPSIFNNVPLDINTPSGKICMAFYAGEKKWFTAMINNLNEKDKTCEVTWLGYKEKEILPWTFIKIQESIKTTEIEIGMFCEAIYYEDGQWYHATIENISEHGVHVKYKKYNDIAVVSYDSIRITPEQKLLNQKRKETINLNNSKKKGRKRRIGF